MNKLRRYFFVCKPTKEIVWLSILCLTLLVVGVAVASHIIATVGTDNAFVRYLLGPIALAPALGVGVKAAYLYEELKNRKINEMYITDANNRYAQNKSKKTSHGHR